MEFLQDFVKGMNGFDLVVFSTIAGAFIYLIILAIEEVFKK